MKVRLWAYLLYLTILGMIPFIPGTITLDNITTLQRQCLVTNIDCNYGWIEYQYDNRTCSDRVDCSSSQIKVNDTVKCAIIKNKCKYGNDLAYAYKVSLGYLISGSVILLVVALIALAALIQHSYNHCLTWRRLTVQDL